MEITTLSGLSYLPDLPKTFREALLRWHAGVDRQLPWKEEPSPYKIWVSEIIMQQTRISQGLQYYHDFLDAFHDVYALSEASEDDVLAVWKGLGYYSRARNMHQAARYIVNHHDGQFPNTYEGLLALPGIGPYTAAAIASFAFNLPHAVIDGNVQRVISRMFGLQETIDSKKGKEALRHHVERCFEPSLPGAFNQAIMDFGALVCTPKPKCDLCPQDRICVARHHGLEDIIPQKTPKKKKVVRHLHFFVPLWNNHIALKKRNGNDIWKGLYDFPSLETDGPELSSSDSNNFLTTLGWAGAKEDAYAGYAQVLTHQIIHASFYIIPITSDQPKLVWYSAQELLSLPIPRIIDKFIQDWLK